MRLADLDPSKVKEVATELKEVEEDEKVVGTISEDLQRLWALQSITANMLQEQTRSHKLTCLHDGGEPCKKLQHGVRRETEFVEICKAIFWTSARKDSDSTANTIGLREDWQLVEMPDEPLGPFRILSSILGLGL